MTARAKSNRPSGIRLETSTHCQLRCPSCPTTAGAIDEALGKGFLRFDDFRRLIDENRWLRTIELSNYGEVFLNPDLLKILEYARKKRVVLTMSNGVNLNHAKEEVLEAVVRTRVGAITCSIDGASQETYVRYRVRGDFDRVIGNIRTINRMKKKYRTSRPHLIWQFVVFGHNEHELPVARRMAAELGMEFKPKLTWDDDFSPIRDAELVKREIAMPGASRSEVRAETGVDYLDGICRQLWNSPQVNWNGDVLGCCFNFWGTFGTNAFRDGLEPALDGETMRYARQMLTGEAPPRSDIPCTSCHIYIDRAASNRWISPSDLKKPPLLRRVLRRVKRAASLVIGALGR